MNKQLLLWAINIVCYLVSLTCVAGELLRDPTMPIGLNHHIAGQSMPVLSSIIQDGTTYLAIIDGEVLSSGEHYRQYQVISVAEKSVVLMRDKKQWTIKLTD